MNNNFQKIFYTLFLFLILGVIWQAALHPYFHVDELEAVHTAWKIMQGEKIYIDFFQHHHPLFYYTLIPLLKLFGETAITLLAIRMFMFAMLSASVYVVYLLTKLLFNKNSAALAVLLLSSCILFIHRGIEIRPDIPQMFFGLLSVYFFFQHLKVKKRYILFLSTISLAISFLYLQKAIFLIIILGLCQLFSIFKKRLNLKDFVSYWIFFIIALSPYYIIILLNGTFIYYLNLNWLLNFNWQKHVSPTPWLLLFLSTNFVMIGAYLAGLWQMKKKFTWQLLGILSLLVFLSAYMAPESRAQYFLMSMPLFAIPAAYSLDLLYRKNKILLNLLLPIAIFPALALFYGSATVDKQYYQYGKIEFMRHITSPEDYIYDGNYNVNVFNVFRRDIDYFWFSLHENGGLDTYKTLWDYDYDIYARIEQFRPKIISNYKIENMDHPSINSHYAPIGVYDNIFIRKD